MTYRFRNPLSMFMATHKWTGNYCFPGRENYFRYVVIVCLLSTVGLSLYANFSFETSAHISKPQNAYRSSSIRQSLWALPQLNSTRLLKTHSRSLKKTLLPGQDFHSRHLVHSDGLESDTSVFRSPFIVHNEKVFQRDRGIRAGVDPGSKNDMRTKIFAVIMNCKDEHFGCFAKSSYYLESCPYNRCRHTTDLETADVVVFYVWRMEKEEYIPKFSRPKHQRWVMWTPEAANRKNNSAVLDFPFLKGQFNWTMTYRLDSDIMDLYGRLQPQNQPRKNYFKIFINKKFPVAWFVSHCKTDSRREEYVRSMQATVDVHIFGACGTYTCSNGSSKRDSDKDVCFPMLSKSYHFYLAFENSLCQDYVTEKFFKMFSDVDVIPVVRGGADYKRFFPPNTFIDASDFKTPEDLGRFLLDLSNDGNRYVAMLKKKNKYRYAPANSMFCDLCEKMLTDDTTKWYPDVRTWFVKDKCYEPTDL